MVVRFLAELTESERSGERLPRAARRVSGSESINRILEFLDRKSGFSGVTGWAWFVYMLQLF
jgi:hypothetical protein